MILQVGVKVLLENMAGELLFLMRSEKVSTDRDELQWDIPGGRIDPSEPLLEALTREVAEETGLNLAGEPTIIAAQDIFVPAKDLHVVRLTYRAPVAEGEITLSEEHGEYAWFAINDAQSQNIDPYVKEVIDGLYLTPA